MGASNPLSMSSLMLWRATNKKLQNAIHSYHVRSVLTILFEEIIVDLRARKDVRIKNFGMFRFAIIPSRVMKDLFNRIITSQDRFCIKLDLAKSVYKYLIDNLDKNKTLNIKEDK